MFEYDFDEPLDTSGIELRPLGDDEMLVALPPDHPLAGEEVVPMARLAGETWVSSADETCNRVLTHGAGRAGFTPRVAFASDDYGAVGRLVIAGVGVALVPALAAAAVGDAVVLRRLEPAPTRSMSVAVAPVRSAAAEAMLALLTSASGRSTSSRAGGRQRLNPSSSASARCSTTSISRCSTVMKRSSTAWSRKPTSFA